MFKLTDAVLETMLSDTESDRVERKSSPADSSKIHQAICAFANDLPNHGKPGVLFVGVTDHGQPSDLPITDEVLTALSNMRDDGKIVPIPSMAVDKRILNGHPVAVVAVMPSDAPPVRYDGRVWIRVGPRRALATPEEERRLNEKRRSRDLTYDLRPISSTTLDDLDLTLFQQVYLRQAVAPDIVEQNQRTLEHQLAGLRMTAVAPPYHPTVTGILVLGKSPADYIPGAYVQFLRLDGIELTDPIIDRKEIHGPLPEMMRLLDDVLIAHNRTQVRIGDQHRETRRSDYPLVALQQITRNAVMHRDYETSNAPVRVTWFSDRVEVMNPGGPYGSVTRANFGRPGVTDYRNPYMAEAMKTLGYVQRFGMGIALTRKAMQDNGNPPPEFEVEENHVLVTLRC